VLRARGHRFDAFSFTVTDERLWDIGALAEATLRVEARVLPPGRRATSSWRRLPPIALELFNYAGVARACARIARAIDAGGYDVAFTHQCRYTHTPPLLTRLRTPSVHYCQEPARRFFEDLSADALAPLRPRLRRPGIAVLAALERRALAAATRLLVNSTYSKEYVYHVYGLPSAVCYLGVDTARFRPGSAERERLVLSVGGLQVSKAHAFVIDAIARLAPPRRPRLTVVADRTNAGFADGLKMRADAAGVDLLIRQGVDDAELAGWYARASVLACAQVLEPFGLVALEAMASATPVVAVSEGGFRETVIEGETGFLTDRDPQRFADRLADVLENPPLRARLGAGGRAWVETRWTWERSVDALEAHLRAARTTTPA
jgi:glycosyltransferase involved in cell wall biosynthesis